MGRPAKILPKRRKSAIELKVEWIHEKYLTSRTYSESFCYGAMREMIKSIGKQSAKRLDYYYVHAYGTSLRVAIKRRFVQVPAYATKLNAMLQGKNPQAKPKENWPAKSRAIAAKRLADRNLWPKKLPPNIRVYQISSTMYRPFKSWGEWYLLNYDVLQGGALTRAGVVIAKPRSPFPDSVGDPDHGDLEFFKDLHEGMNALFRRYNQRCDKGVWDPFYNKTSLQSKGKIAERCLPRAQKLVTLFKTANKGEAARNMLKSLQKEIAQLKDWKQHFSK